MRPGDEPMIELLRLPRRSVHYLPGTAPASFLLVDDRAGAILVNCPPFAARVLASVDAIARPAFLFLPSRFGAFDLDRWRTATGARAIAGAEEAGDIAGTVDERIDANVRFYGRLDFLPLAGRTRGTYALRVKEPPAIVFFGPALEHADWPVLRPHADDHSYENRVIGALGLRDLEFEFAFCDNYLHGKSKFGPGAGGHVHAELATEFDV